MCVNGEADKKRGARVGQKKTGENMDIYSGGRLDKSQGLIWQQMDHFYPIKDQRSNNTANNPPHLQCVPVCVCVRASACVHRHMALCVCKEAYFPLPPAFILSPSVVLKVQLTYSAFTLQSHYKRKN